LDMFGAKVRIVIRFPSGPAFVPVSPGRVALATLSQNASTHLVSVAFDCIREQSSRCVETGGGPNRGDRSSPHAETPSLDFELAMRFLPNKDDLVGPLQKLRGGIAVAQAFLFVVRGYLCRFGSTVGGYAVVILS